MGEKNLQFFITEPQEYYRTIEEDSQGHLIQTPGSKQGQL